MVVRRETAPATIVSAVIAANRKVAVAAMLVLVAMVVRLETAPATIASAVIAARNRLSPKSMTVNGQKMPV